MTVTHENRISLLTPEQVSLIARRLRKLVFPIGLVTVILSLVMGVATFLILTGLTPIVPTHNVVVTMLAINGVLVAVMICIIVWQIAELFLARKRQDAGSRLHIRIVGLFSVIAVIPAILLAIFASISLDRGLDHWFSSRTKSIINSAIDVANSYLSEHGQVIRADIVATANDLEANASQFQAYVNSITGLPSNIVESDPARFGPFLTVQASMRALPGAYLLDGQGKILSKASGDDEIPFIPPSREHLKAAEAGRIVLIPPGQTNQVRALKRIEKFDDAYLYLVRMVDPKVITHLRNTRENVIEYGQLDQRRTGVQIAFGLMYVAIALTLLLAALWLGLWFANRLVSPIRRLITAANVVSEGDLDVKVKVKKRDGDLGQLSSTFNTMVTVLKEQRNDLLNVNTLLNDRRRFMEAVLSGVSAGVIGVNVDGNITLVNRSAEKLLSVSEKDLLDQPLSNVLGDFSDLYLQAREQPDKFVQDQIMLVIAGVERNFAVRVTREQSGDEDHGYIITFDDITELVTAQRSSAWADVARRIAHEIKNPLTPIQLSAERIRRKYGKSITEDREIFEQCTDTIIRQVGDIGRMVDEFSSFARMPKPVMEQNDVRTVVRDAVTLFSVSEPEIDFPVELDADPIMTLCDQRLLSQAVTNLVKNATEAIAARTEQDPEQENFQGEVKTVVRSNDKNFIVEVIDNGIGLPAKHRNRLLEPYMTTREKGTGLGLAIVQKIAEQHGGTVQLEDASHFREVLNDNKVNKDNKDNKEGNDTGACVRMIIPIAAPMGSHGDTEPHDNSGLKTDEGIVSTA